MDKLKSTDEMTPELTFKELYFINFIGANDYDSEEALESLILNNITDFLQELGTDFCFVARQKRMSTGTKDRYLDLLFFNRRLRRLIALELKLGEFDPAYKGQMEWYLNWLDKNERLEFEDKPMGIIFCAGKDHDDIEYLEMDKTGIHVAQYLTELPPQEILEKKLKLAVQIARENQKSNESEKKRNKMKRIRAYILIIIGVSNMHSISHAHDGSNTYVLSTSEQARKNLDYQHELMASES